LVLAINRFGNHWVLPALLDSSKKINESKSETEAQHKIIQQPNVGLLHQVAQSNPLLAHKYTPSKLEGPHQFFVTLKWLLVDRVLAAEAKTRRLTDFKLDHVFANTAAGILESTLNLKRTNEDEATSMQNKKDI